MPKYFDIIPPEELRKYQSKAVAKKRENNVKRHKLAHSLYLEEGIESVMQVFHVKKAEAYKMVDKGKTLKSELGDL